MVFRTQVIARSYRASVFVLDLLLFLGLAAKRFYQTLAAAKGPPIRGIIPEVILSHAKRNFSLRPQIFTLGKSATIGLNARRHFEPLTFSNGGRYLKSRTNMVSADYDPMLPTLKKNRCSSDHASLKSNKN